MGVEVIVLYETTTLLWAPLLREAYKAPSRGASTKSTEGWRKMGVEVIVL